MLSFNGMLAKDDDMKVVFVLFYTALLYHVAQLMQHQGISLPGAITFSGTGSKVLTIISSDDTMLGKLARVIFEKGVCANLRCQWPYAILRAQRPEGSNQQRRTHATGQQPPGRYGSD